MIHILGWVAAGWVGRGIFGAKKGEEPEVEGAPPNAPPSASPNAPAPPARFGMQVVGAPEAAPAPAGAPPRAPMDPALPLDPEIDEDTERAVLGALQSIDRRAILGFADSMSNPQGPYPYFPIAAGVLRYHAAALQRAEAIQAKKAAAAAPSPRPAPAPGASAVPAPKAPRGKVAAAPKADAALAAPAPPAPEGSVVASGTTHLSAATHDAVATQQAPKLNGKPPSGADVTAAAGDNGAVTTP
jgi:hypothetical protein